MDTSLTPRAPVFSPFSPDSQLLGSSSDSGTQTGAGFLTDAGDAYREDAVASPAVRGDHASILDLSRFAVPTLAALFWSGLAVAAPNRNIPDFDPAQHVYCVPADRCPYPTAKLEEALDQLTYPAYVLLYARVGGEMQDVRVIMDTVDTAQDRWSEDRRFVPGHMTIVGHAVEERTYYSLPGAHFASEHHFERVAVKAVEQAHFVPKAKSGDLQGAMTSLVVALDRKYVEFEKGEMRTLTQAAQDLLNSPDITDAEKAALQAVYDQAQRFSSGELADVPVSVLIELPERLQSQIDELKPLQAERQQTRSGFESARDGLRSAARHPELQAADTADLEYAAKILGRARAFENTSDYDGMAAWTRSTQDDSRLSGLLSRLEDRTKVRGALNETLMKSRTAVSTVLGKGDNNSNTTELALAEAHSYADLIKSSSDIEPMRLATQKLLAAQQAYDALVSTRAQVTDLVEKMRVTMTNESDLLEDDSLVEYQQAIDQAEAALTRAEEVSLKNETLPILSSASEKLASLVEQRSLEQGTRRMLTAVGILALLAVTGGALIRRHRFNQAREDFNTLAQEWLVKIDRHSKQLVDAVMGGEAEVKDVISEFSEIIKGELIRDGALNQSILDFLGSKKGETATTLREFQDLLKSGHDGLARLRRHVEKHMELAAKAGFIRQEPLRLAAEGLAVLEDDNTNLFDLELDENPEGDQPARTSIADFWKTLTANYKQMRTLWLQLLAAIRAANRKAEADLPAEEYEAFVADTATVVSGFLGEGKGGQSGRESSRDESSPESDDDIIIKNLFARHPFFDKSALWQRVNALRDEDPAASMQAVDEARAGATRVQTEVGRISQALQAAKAVLDRAQAITVDYSGTTLNPGADPRLAEVDARQARQDLLDGLKKDSATEIAAKIQAWAQILGIILAKKQAVVSAMAQADADVKQATARLVETRNLIAGAKSRDDEMAVFHDDTSMTPARTARTSAEASLQLLDQAEAETRAQLSARNHVEAVKRAAQAVQHADAAASAIQNFYAQVQELVAVRAAYENLYDALVQASGQAGGRRPTYTSRLYVLRDFGGEELLAEGDAHLQTQRRDPRQGGPIDWAASLGTLQQVEKLWQRGVHKAENRRDVAGAQETVRQLAAHYIEKVLSKMTAEKDYHDSTESSTLSGIESSIDKKIKALTHAATEAARLVNQDDIAAGNKAREILRDKSGVETQFQSALAEVAKLKKLRDDYRREHSAAESTRSTRASEVRRYDGNVSSDLADGDRIFKSLPEPDSAGQNYASLRSKIDSAEREWSEGVAAARRRQEEEERLEKARLAAIAAEKAKKEAEERRRDDDNNRGGGGGYGSDHGRGGGGSY